MTRVAGVRSAGASFGRHAARHVITYLTLALTLFPEDDYREVATKVTGSLDRRGCWNVSWSVPIASAVTQARKRLGRDVVAELFERCCGRDRREVQRHMPCGRIVQGHRGHRPQRDRSSPRRPAHHLGGPRGSLTG